MGSATLTLFFLLVVMLSSSLIHSEQIAVKTIKTVVGDIYDCVDIRKQPGFDHTLLQDQEIQMAASSRKTIENLITVDCPKGTVPIRRRGKEELVRDKLFAETYSSNLTSITDDSPGRRFTVLMPPNDDPNKPYWGIEATLSLNSLEIGSTQSSFAQMWLDRGDSSLQTGWMVSPSKSPSGDSLTRLFAYWKTKETDGCFNLHCDPGFVQVHQTIPVDVVFNKTSQYDGFQFTITLRIVLSENHWWLVYNGHEEKRSQDVRIGYWPNGLLPDLDSLGADTYAWGGVATGHPDEPGPPMGNGHFDEQYPDRVAFMSGLGIVGNTKSWISPRGVDHMQKYGENSRCYALKYLGHDGRLFTTYGLFYGGPGGNCK